MGGRSCRGISEKAPAMFHRPGEIRAVMVDGSGEPLEIMWESGTSLVPQKSHIDEVELTPPLEVRRKYKVGK